MENLTSFGLNFLLANNRLDNQLISPLGLQVMLNLLLLGQALNGTTNQNWSSEPAKIDDKSSELKLTLVNFMATNTDRVNLKPQFELDARKYFNSSFEHFSRSRMNISQNWISRIFSRPIKPLHERLNGWISKETNKSIDRLISPEEVRDKHWNSLIGSVAHLKGRWTKQFVESDSAEMMFHDANGGEKKMLFMRQEDSFKFASFERKAEDEVEEQDEIDAMSERQLAIRNLSLKLDCKVVELSFNGNNQLNMTVFLPRTLQGLPDLLRALDEPTIREARRLMNFEQSVRVFLPELSLETSYRVESSLPKLGLSSMLDLNDALSDSEDSNSRLSFDWMMHKTKLKIQHAGFEVDRKVVHKRKPNYKPGCNMFVADRPFFFIISEARKLIPIFMGIVNHVQK